MSTNQNRQFDCRSGAANVRHNPLGLPHGAGCDALSQPLSGEALAARFYRLDGLPRAAPTLAIRCWELPRGLPVINNSCAASDGCAAVPIYLFRRKGCDRSFAYSPDATGRYIPPNIEDEEWVYVGMVASEQLRNDPEALRQLRADGFYMFKA